MHVTKRLDLMLLERELVAASVPTTGLGHTGTDTDGEVFTYAPDPGGMLLPAELPPEAGPVVDAHVAPPLLVDYVASTAVNAVVRTVDGAPLEVFRFPTKPKHVYKAAFEMMAVDAVSGATRNTEAKMTFKRPSTTLVQVGATSVPYNAPDPATASWAITPSVVGTDLVISVSAAAGRTVDWTLVGSIGTYAPEGLDP